MLSREYIRATIYSSMQQQVQCLRKILSEILEMKTQKLFESNTFRFPKITKLRRYYESWSVDSLSDLIVFRPIRVFVVSVQLK